MLTDTSRVVKNQLTTRERIDQGGVHEWAVGENSAYTAFCSRAIRAVGRRVADGDVDALIDLAHLAHNLDQALAAAVIGLRAYGYSWNEIATRLGTTRQTAQQRWRDTT